MNRPVLLYDADCGFCTRTATWLRRLGIRADVRPIGAPGTHHLGVDLARAGRELPYVHPDGHVVYGAAAALAAAARGPLPMRILATMASPRLLRPLLDLAYGAVARNRHRLPGGTSSCALDEHR